MANLSSLVEQANSLHVSIAEDYKQRIQVAREVLFPARAATIKMKSDNTSAIDLRRKRNIVDSYRVSGLSGPMYF